MVRFEWNESRFNAMLRRNGAFAYSDACIYGVVNRDVGGVRACFRVGRPDDLSYVQRCAYSFQRLSSIEQDALRAAITDGRPDGVVQLLPAEYIFVEPRQRQSYE